jgi:GntR family transcriptional regulator / MocR family aminotransferase
VVGRNSHLLRFLDYHYDWAMRKAPAGFSPVIAVDRAASRPLHRQICEAFKAAILEGNLSVGQQVPSTRALSLELGVSRIPILNAYAQLIAEGYLETRSGAGTFVSTTLPQQHAPSGRAQSTAGRSHQESVALSHHSRHLANRASTPWTYGSGAFSVGQLAFDQFPMRVWSNLVCRHARRITVSSLNYGDPMGSKEFREAVATYLRTARAVRCEPDQILVVSGSQQALDLSARVLFDTGNRVWVEEPSYSLMRHALTLAGCELVPVPVDDNGLDVAAGMALCRHAKGAYVTPSHQFPLGVTMSASRRLQLLEWANRAGSWIVEDDYDSEYRYESKPIASLQGLDRNSRVVYIGTFSKTLFPAVRLGYMVLPPDLVDHFVAVRRVLDIFPSSLYQGVLADFINQGHFARHIRRTRLVYAERRTALVDAIRSEFGTQLEICGSEAGMHLVVLLPKGFRDDEIAARAARRKLWLWPLSPSYLGKPARKGFILGFAGTPAPEIPAAVRRLKSFLTSEAGWI